MDRRTFIGMLGGAAAAWPSQLAAQQSGRPFRVGLVMGVNSPIYPPARAAFLDEMQKLGLIEGQHFTLDARSNQIDSPALLALMSELVAAKTDVIIAGGTEQTLRAAVSAGPNVPIVMWANNFDPIAGGYVQSLAKPGGNVTGVFTRQPELAEKQVELLREAFPQRKRLALVWDAQTADQFEAAERRARLLGFDVSPHKLDNMPYDIPAAFRAIMSKDPELLQVASGPNIGTYPQQIVDQAARYRLPSIYIFRSYVERGGLISYASRSVRAFAGSPPWLRKSCAARSPPTCRSSSLRPMKWR